MKIQSFKQLNLRDFFYILILSSFGFQTNSYAKNIDYLCAFLKHDFKDSQFEMRARTAITIEEDPLLKLALEGACDKRELLLSEGPVKVYKTLSDSVVLVTGTDPLKGTFTPFYLTKVPSFTSKQTIISSNGDQLVTRVMIPTKKNLKTTILMRTPYHLASPKHYLKDYFRYVGLGYNVIIQPIAGSVLNTGVFKWLNLEKEAKDASATMDWIEKQSWSNGKVILIGTSYPGSLALAGASTNHPSIIATIASSAPTNKNRHSLSNGGSVLGKLAYEIAVNSHIANYERVWPSLYRISQNYNYNQIDPLLNETGFSSFNLDAVANDEKNEKEHRTFIEKIKQTSFSIVHAGGAFSDQDSLDSYENFKDLEDREDNYFILHPDGHSDVTERSLLKRFSQREQSKSSFTNMMKDLMYGRKFCATTASFNFGVNPLAYNPLTKENCYDSSKDFESSFEKVTFKFKYSHDIQNGNSTIQFFKINSHELGIFFGPIRIEVKHKIRNENTVKTTDFSLLLKQKNLPQQSLNIGNIYINEKGDRQSSATSNFTFFSHLDLENEMTLYLIKRDNETKDAKEKLEVESIELTLLRKKAQISKLLNLEAF
ncbi:CocE/NonD family hydrolase [Halobacteriovorax sp. GB3]|uniref:CocE/NonD family hydrolase n=1 Tax=Halobacteriovorax sp. GB3 TaxID=2719615 RepID=UPI00235F8B03|nr:CocE/NonD family hydrolase [Halobacteriovorax sp. GB3]